MASNATPLDHRPARRLTQLSSSRMILLCWLPIMAIGLLHYSTEPSHAWVHNILRRLYYIPIILAAFAAGLRGSLAASFIVSLTYLPHAFALIGHAGHFDPAGPWEKALEVVLYNTVGGIAGYLATAERKRSRQLQGALEAQQQLQSQLVRAGQLSALGELVAGVTHEIKTPLHSLRGTAEIVDPVIPDGCPERRMWDLHKAEIDRLGGIAERFQTFAKPQTGEMSEVDLNTVASRLGDLLSAEARKHEIRVTVETAESRTHVKADRDQLAQVGLNIGINAVRAMEGSGGTIRIRVCPSERNYPNVMHALKIDNDGPRIPDELIPNLFDPFVSGDRAGTGLGLSIAERIVELHGGYIEADNADLGVCFSVLLPSGDSELS